MTWLSSSIDFLNHNSGAIVAIATAVIAFFSFTNWRILRWEKEKDRRNRQPVLVLADEIGGDCRDLYIENIGYGPAMNIVRTIAQRGSRLAHVSTNEPLPIRPLGPGQRAYAYCATSSLDTGPPILDDPLFEATVEYDDIFGNFYETRYRQRQHSIRRILRRRYPPHQAERV